ncbi:unnamed protein product [Vitrella brassicaformis CCMP3155]|uniref:RNA-editing substrate-binding complex 6 protein domain-containing protein n=3 Tax=Vitrella brassicaformis TaxID=1169539 RepID=A0A0G4FZU4_VITBC|nr:unnamed protein product [Vitrella brassicaformis CCMP3155]|eukprot:CEM21059.1 unnamed protein product [Vitrella brassicaformis CCMP3155]
MIYCHRSISTVHDQIPSDYSDAAAASLPQLSVKNLGHYALRASQIGVATPAVWRQLSSLLKERVESMDPKDCLRVLKAFEAFLPAHTQAARRDSPLDEELLLAVGKQIALQCHQMRAGEIAAAAYVFSEHRALYAPLYAALAIAFSLKIASAAAADLTLVALAYARLYLADQNLFGRLAAASVVLLGTFKTHELASLLMSFGLVGIRHDVLFIKAADTVTQKLPQFSAEELALIAFAYARFHLIVPGLVHRLRSHLPHRAEQLSGTQVAELAISCARLGITHEKLTSLYCDKIDFGSLGWPLFAKCAAALGSLEVTHALTWHTIARETLRRLEDGGNRENTPGPPGDSPWRLADRTMPLEDGSSALSTIDGPPLGCLVDIFAAFGDLMGCVKTAAELSSLVPDVLKEVGPLVADGGDALDGQQVMRLFRSMRRLPQRWTRSHDLDPRVSNVENVGGLEGLQRVLIGRVLTLLDREQMRADEVLSTAYSMICLYPHSYHVEERIKTREASSFPSLEGFLTPVCCGVSELLDDDRQLRERHPQLWESLDNKQQQVVQQFMSRHFPRLPLWTIPRPIAIQPKDVPDAVTSPPRNETQTPSPTRHEDEHFFRVPSMPSTDRDAPPEPPVPPCQRVDLTYSLPQSLVAELGTVLSGMGVAHQRHYTEGPYVVPVVEADRPVAYVFLSQEDHIHVSGDGATASYDLRCEKQVEMRFLGWAGWRIASLPFFVWRGLRGMHAKAQWIREKREEMISELDSEERDSER